jgi:ABC-2 type transport system permease protein
MVNVILEIARKEIISYYGRKGIIMQNALLALIFCFVPLQQIQGAIVASGYRASVFSGTMEFYLLFGSLYPVVIASGISIFAFPVERDIKTIEHLLSLPLTNAEIFLGKALAAVATALVWAAIMFTVILGYTLYSNGEHIIWDAPLFTPSLSIMLFAIVPAIILLSTLMTVALTSYISNTRGAYMINIVAMGAMIGVTGARSVLMVEPAVFNMVLLGALLLLLVATYAVSVKSFNREKLIAKT